MAADKKKAPANKPKKEGRKVSVLYEISGDSISRKNKSCPKCGQGTFLAKHKDRVVCGKCGYMEMNSKREEVKEESA
jgi:ubiquitin-small subunit ribosomal protein S27Ae